MMLLSNRYCTFLAVLLLSSFYLVQGGDSECWDVGGRCQYTSERCVSYRSGLCAGPNNRKCCVIEEDLNCWRIGGLCKDNQNSCSGRYIKRLCGGDLSRQCCA